MISLSVLSACLLIFLCFIFFYSSFLGLPTPSFIHLSRSSFITIYEPFLVFLYYLLFTSIHLCSPLLSWVDSLLHLDSSLYYLLILQAWRLDLLPILLIFLGLSFLPIFSPSFQAYKAYRCGVSCFIYPCACLCFSSYFRFVAVIFSILVYTFMFFRLIRPRVLGFQC